MNKEKYEKLMEKLDNCLESHNISHPCPVPTEPLCSVGTISSTTNVEQLDNNELSLFHSMLHMFYNNRNGKGLSPKTIERLHKETVGKLKSHKSFDRLDKK
jgi:hypothetical protein